MRKTWIGWIALSLSAAGCRDNTPPPPSASVPPMGTYTSLRGELSKPLPDPEPPIAPGGFADEPLITQAAPEQPAFVGAYAGVGSPRVSVFINRTLQGQIIPTNTGGPIGGVEQTRQSSGAVKMESNQQTVDPWGRPITSSNGRFESSGPVEVRDRTEIYLAPGQYDEVSAKRVDYDAIENVMTDWLAAGGKVTMVSPTLTQAQVGELQQGRRNVLQELAKENQVDVLIQVQAHPTRQTREGLEVRLIAEAINTQGGESIGRAVVDVPPPLDKPTINEYTRFLARKLMSDMTRTWSNPRPAPLTAPPATQTAPPAVPTTNP